MRGTIHHLDLTVADPDRSVAFYERVLGFLGYRKHPAGYDFDLTCPDGSVASVGVVAAHGSARHNRYAPGLHHVAWRAESRADVDRLHRLLIEMNAVVLDAPADYPEYGRGYYAVFFADPDGLKLEFVYHPAER